MILLISALGLTLDSLLNYSGVITFAKPETTIWPFPPPWYWPIWIGLISWLIDFSDFFSGKRLLCAVLGAIGVAFSFLAGQKLGAVTINKSIYIIAAIWFFLFPSLIELIGWSKSWNKN